MWWPLLVQLVDLVAVGVVSLIWSVVVERDPHTQNAGGPLAYSLWEWITVITILGSVMWFVLVTPNDICENVKVEEQVQLVDGRK